MLERERERGWNGGGDEPANRRHLRSISAREECRERPHGSSQVKGGTAAAHRERRALNPERSFRTLVTDVTGHEVRRDRQPARPLVCSRPPPGAQQRGPGDRSNEQKFYHFALCPLPFALCPLPFALVKSRARRSVVRIGL